MRFFEKLVVAYFFWATLYFVQCLLLETINGRPGLRMAVRRRPKSVGAVLAYGVQVVCPLCLWRTAPLQLPLVSLYKCYAFYCMLFTNKVRIRFTVWLVSGYAHVCIQLSIVIVPFPLESGCYKCVNLEEKLRQRLWSRRSPQPPLARGTRSGL